MLVLEEPTFGVDVGARAEIYRILGDYVDAGNGVLLVSSDFEEVAGIAIEPWFSAAARIVAEVLRATCPCRAHRVGHRSKRRRRRDGRMSGPTKRRRVGSGSSSVLRFLSVYGLLLLLLALFVLFSLLLPNTFPTEINIRAMLSDKSIIAILAFAEMVPIATDAFDLSIG